MGAVNSNSGRSWRDVDLKNLLSSPALGIGAGSATDTGFAWSLPTEVEHPIVLSAGPLYCIEDSAVLNVYSRLCADVGRSERLTPIISESVRY